MFPPSFLSRHVRQISSAAVFTDAGDAAIEKEVNALSSTAHGGTAPATALAPLLVG